MGTIVHVIFGPKKIRYNASELIWNSVNDNNHHVMASDEDLNK